MNSIITQRFIKCHNKLKQDKIIKSSRQFAMKLDYLPQSLSEILKLRRDVTLELLRKSVEKFRINPVFLLTGEGPMFMSEDEQQGFRVLAIVTTPDDDERIVHVPVPAQAGYASEYSDPVFIQELPTYTLPDYKYKTGTHRSFDVAGDSMEPTLFEGDKVVCSFVEPDMWDKALKDNYVYVIVTRSDVLVKRIENNIAQKKSLLLISDNAFYAPFDVNVSEIVEIWYVRARISPFLPSPQNVQNLLHNEVRELRQTIQEQSRAISELSRTVNELVNK